MNQKSRNKLLLFLMASSAILCSQIGVREVPAQTQATQSTPPAPAVLEIVKDERGMVPYWGKSLYFRLYENGRVEYEELIRPQENSPMKPVKHERQLNKQDYQVIVKLLEAPDFLDAREYYKQPEPIDDAVYLTAIHSNFEKHSKQITMVNFTASSPKGKGYYPESIIILMTEIKRLREE